MINAKIDISKDIEKAINDALESEIKKHIEEVRDKIVANALISISKTIDMRTIGETIIFEVKKL